MLNGMSRFPTFTINRFKMAEKILKSQVPSNEPLTESNFVELDMGRLFQNKYIESRLEGRLKDSARCFHSEMT